VCVGCFEFFYFGITYTLACLLSRTIDDSCVLFWFVSMARERVGMVGFLFFGSFSRERFA
jgi:hypothetical protein